MADDKTEKVLTRIWLEEPEPDNAFATRAAYCHGFDVYGEMLGRASWSDMLYLLFLGETPSRQQATLLNALAVALANAGPRDPAVHAAMCAGVGGSTAAASLMAALAVGAGQHTGAREVLLSMQLWTECGVDLTAWRRRLSEPRSDVAGIWPEAAHLPGFDPHAQRVSVPVRQALSCLASFGVGGCLSWLEAHRPSLEAVAGKPLSMVGVAAAGFIDLGLTPEQGEMLYLLLRLPGAAVHALEQRQVGHRNFPFFALELENDPLKEAA